MSSGPSILCYSDPGIVSFQCSRVCKRSVLVGRRYFVFKPNLHFRFEMRGARGERGCGWKGAKVSVHRSETMFNITWHLCQTVCRSPPLGTHRLSGFLCLRDLPLVAFLPKLSDLLSVNQKKWMKFDLSNFFFMWWHEKPWRVMCSLLSLVRPVCIPLLGSCGLSEALGLTGGWGEGSGIVFHACVLEGEPRVCSPGSGHPLKPQRRQRKPGQTDTFEKVSESSDYVSGF